MDFKVILKPVAIKDLEEITGRIAKDDGRVAERFGNKLIDRPFHWPGSRTWGVSHLNLVIRPFAKLSMIPIESYTAYGGRTCRFTSSVSGMPLAASLLSKLNLNHL